MKLTGAQIILECLSEQNIDTVFGYPGGNVLELYDALYDNNKNIRHIITSHEQGACHAADGYARASGRTGVVIATSGPGATNLVTGIANAYMDSIPLVAITGNVPLSQLGRDSFQEIDITGITIPITKQNYIVKEITRLAHIVREAFKIAEDGRKGPVLIDVPKNIFSETCQFERQHKNAPVKREIDVKKLSAAITLINSAKCPLIFAGGGVISANAMPKLQALSDKMNAPICSTLMGIGCDTPHYLGFAGMHGSTTANLAIKHCDLLIAVGTRFSDRLATNREFFAKDARILHIDIDNAEIDKNINTDCHIIGDANDILEKLTNESNGASSPEWLAMIETFKRHTPQLSKNVLSPQAVCQAISDMTDDDQIIVTDVGQHQMWTAQFYPFKRPRTFITSGGLGTMGFGMGAAIGASMFTGKKTFLITGDGSFHMNMNELATAVKYHLPIIVIVMNNHVLGMVRQLQKVFFNNRFSETSIDRNTDYVALSKAFGGDGGVIKTYKDIQPVLSAALHSPVVHVIDVELSRDENVLPMIPSGKSVDESINEIKDQ